MCGYTTILAFPALFNETPKKTITVGTECQLEVSGLMKLMLKFAFESVIVGLKKIGLHFNLAYHTIP